MFESEVQICMHAWMMFEGNRETFCFSIALSSKWRCAPLVCHPTKTRGGVEQKLCSLCSDELQIKININSSNTPHLSTTWPSERTCLGLSDHPTQQRPLLCTSTPPPMSFDCIDAELRPPLTKTSLGVSTFPDHFCHRNNT